jgi:4-hydroxybenzoate polyprenyltransferase
MNKINKYLSLIKFSHSIFALPFALIGFFLALDATIIISKFAHYQIITLIILCMIFAAMAFNRYLDRNIDAKNPRTQIREIPSGVITPKNALLFTIVCSIAFIVCTYFINTLCFYLSFVALAVVLGYSYTKRFTPLCHLVLGLGLSLAPIGAYIAISNQFELLPILFSCVVLFWVSGFDIIYALQDEAFDKANKLKSIPVLLGAKNALLLSRVFHFIAAAIILYVGFVFPFKYLYWIGAIVFCLLLIRQHSIVQYNNLSKINMAFFTLNGIASIVFAIFVITDLLLFK